MKISEKNNQEKDYSKLKRVLNHPHNCIMDMPALQKYTLLFKQKWNINKKDKLYNTVNSMWNNTLIKLKPSKL